MTQYTSTIRTKWQEINGMPGTELGEWVAVGFLLKNLTDSYDQWRTVKYNTMRTSTLHFDDLAGELEAEEYRINATSSSAANYVKNRQGSNSTQDGKQQDKKK